MSIFFGVLSLIGATVSFWMCQTVESNAQCKEWARMTAIGLFLALMCFGTAYMAGGQP